MSVCIIALGIRHVNCNFSTQQYIVTYGLSPDRHWDQPSLLIDGYRAFPGSKERPGRDADPSTPSSSVVIKE